MVFIIPKTGSENILYQNSSGSHYYHYYCLLLLYIWAWKLLTDSSVPWRKISVISFHLQIKEIWIERKYEVLKLRTAGQLWVHFHFLRLLFNLILLFSDIFSETFLFINQLPLATRWSTFSEKVELKKQCILVDS